MILCIMHDMEHQKILWFVIPTDYKDKDGRSGVIQDNMTGKEAEEKRSLLQNIRLKKRWRWNDEEEEEEEKMRIFYFEVLANLRGETLYLGQYSILFLGREGSEEEMKKKKKNGMEVIFFTSPISQLQSVTENLSSIKTTNRQTC